MPSKKPKPNLQELFAVLCLPPTATEQEVRRAYHQLALRHHPDKPEGDTEKMKVINVAYNQIIDLHLCQSSPKATATPGSMARPPKPKGEPAKPRRPPAKRKGSSGPESKDTSASKPTAAPAPKPRPFLKTTPAPRAPAVPRTTPVSQTQPAPKAEPVPQTYAVPAEHPVPSEGAARKRSVFPQTTTRERCPPTKNASTQTEPPNPGVPLPPTPLPQEIGHTEPHDHEIRDAVNDFDDLSELERTNIRARYMHWFLDWKKGKFDPYESPPSLQTTGPEIQTGYEGVGHIFLLLCCGLVWTLCKYLYSLGWSEL